MVDESHSFCLSNRRTSSNSADSLFIHTSNERLHISGLSEFIYLRIKSIESPTLISDIDKITGRLCKDWRTFWVEQCSSVRGTADFSRESFIDVIYRWTDFRVQSSGTTTVKYSYRKSSFAMARFVIE